MKFKKKLTKEMVIKVVLYGACRIPEESMDIADIKQQDLIWAENNIMGLPEFDLPVWCMSNSGFGYGNGYGYGYGYGFGNGYGDGDGDSDGYGDGYGNGYGDGYGFGYGDNYGFGYGYGDGYGFGDSDGYGDGKSDGGIISEMIEKLL